MSVTEVHRPEPGLYAGHLVNLFGQSEQTLIENELRSLREELVGRFGGLYHHDPKSTDWFGSFGGLPFTPVREGWIASTLIESNVPPGPIFRAVAGLPDDFDPRSVAVRKYLERLRRHEKIPRGERPRSMLRAAQKAEAFEWFGLEGVVLHPSDDRSYVEYAVRSVEKYAHRRIQSYGAPRLFFRPCPAVPDAGASVAGAESRPFNSVDEIADDLAAIRELGTTTDTLTLTSPFEEKEMTVERVSSVVIAPYVDADLSAVAAAYADAGPGGDLEGEIAVGLRNDGVTAGGASVVFPAQIDESLAIVAARMGLDPNAVEFEIVSPRNRDSGTHTSASVYTRSTAKVVQYRRAAPHERPSAVPGVRVLQGFGTVNAESNFFDASTLAALDVSTGVVERMDDPARAVLCQTSGSTLSHAAAQARALGCAFVVASPEAALGAVREFGDLSDPRGVRRGAGQGRRRGRVHRRRRVPRRRAVGRFEPHRRRGLAHGHLPRLGRRPPVGADAPGGLPSRCRRGKHHRLRRAGLPRRVTPRDGPRPYPRHGPGPHGPPHVRRFRTLVGARPKRGVRAVADPSR